MIVLIGVDIGQKRDPTAIAVVELQRRELAPALVGRRRREDHYLVHFLERLPLGTPYPQIALRLAEICQRVAERGCRPRVFVDATGVGEPVVEMLDEKASEAKRLWAVYFTHGDRCVEDSTARRVNLGKAYMVSRLQALLQANLLHLPDTPEAQVLARELLEYEIQVTEDANERYGAFRVGSQDDLVTAVGMAVHKRPVVSVYPEPSSEPSYQDWPSGLSAMTGLWGSRGLSGL